VPLPAEGELSAPGFDGECFWVYRVLGELRRPEDADRLQSQLVRMDSSGEVLQTYDLEEPLSGLAFDGERLWAVYEDFDEEVFYTIDPATGALVREFSTPPVGRDDKALAASGDRLWLLTSGEPGERLVFGIDMTSGSAVELCYLPEIVAGGMTYADGFLWVGDPGIREGEILQVDPETGEVMEIHTVSGGFIIGLTTDGTDIYVAETHGNTIYKLER